MNISTKEFERMTPTYKRLTILTKGSDEVILLVKER